MRTTLDIDDDILAAARCLAAQRKQSLGKAVSDLARQAFQTVTAGKVRNGVPLLSHTSGGRTPVTLELVNKLYEDNLDK